MKYAIYKVFKVSPLERNFFFNAFFTSFFIRIKLIFVPFSKYSKKIGTLNVLPEKTIDFDEVLVANIKQAIRRSVKYSLWRNKCLEQSVTAKKMLQKSNVSSTIYFGVRKNDDKLEAHAWVKIGDTFVIGEKNHDAFTVVAFYT